jgi:hypothetical protein
MFKIPTTLPEIAKYGLQMVVAAKASTIIADQLIDHTDMDPDGIPVKAISGVGGYVVAGQLKPITDRIVDETVLRVNGLRESFKSRKCTTE